jgi:hypothetical protein
MMLIFVIGVKEKRIIGVLIVVLVLLFSYRFGFPQAKVVLQSSENIKEVKEESYFGDPLDWKEVDKLFPRYVTANLIDIETGKRFEVVRRGGTYHADIQPLTAKDTKILQEIYLGSWSWKRRAVVMELGQIKIAASINGMPHGQGIIKENEFPGHFCIHFLNCRVHKSRKIDTAHQMMVWKAAGLPEMPFLDADPEKVIELVITAFNQADGALASQGLYCSEAQMWLLSGCILAKLPLMDIEKISLQKEESSTEKRFYQMQMSFTYPEIATKIKRTGEVVLELDKSLGRWKMEAEGLRIMLLKNSE